MHLLRNKQMIVALAAILLLVASAGIWWALNHSELTQGVKVAVVPADTREVRLVSLGDGELTYRVTDMEGNTSDLTPVQYAQLLEEDHRNRPTYMRILNITTTAGIMWVFVGIFAQVLFMGRMIVQWIASERSKRSVVPPIFWWMSLGGSSMLIVYFLWRKDIVGVFGQATGWIVYVRNLVLIARETGDPDATTAAQPLDEEPALAEEPAEQPELVSH
ncbi:MAG: lipid-A-disaccharide synthase N-terminal domain-containing protein [Phycisphaeraceae bacterium]